MKFFTSERTHYRIVWRNIENCYALGWNLRVLCEIGKLKIIKYLTI